MATKKKPVKSKLTKPKSPSRAKPKLRAKPKAKRIIAHSKARAKKATQRISRVSRRKVAVFLGFVAVLAIGLIIQINRTQQPHLNTPDEHNHAKSQLHGQFLALIKQVGDFENKQSQANLSVVSRSSVQAEISAISLDFNETSLADAKTDMAKLSKNLAIWQSNLTKAQVAKAAAVVPRTIAAALIETGLDVPILLYHQPPSDLETQLQYLISHHYNDITLDQLASALHGGAKLPPKPVILTFDDGYSDQMTAFNLLEKYHLKATFYIIIIRADSGCEAGSVSCNPDYLSWSQVKQLDSSGLVTIGDHTVDHPDLATLSADQQRSEITSAKTELEAKLGHVIRHFAYPYGSFNETTIGIVQSLGFSTAVSTIPGVYQSKGNIDSLYRIRDVYSLP